jgi:predicted DNA-binding protein
MITMTVPERFEKQLVHIAEKEKIATNNLMKMLMDKALAEFIEDYFDARIGEAAIEELQRGEDTTVSLKEAMRLLNEMGD